MTVETILPYILFSLIHSFSFFAVAPFTWILIILLFSSLKAFFSSFIFASWNLFIFPLSSFLSLLFPYIYYQMLFELLRWILIMIPQVIWCMLVGCRILSEQKWKCFCNDNTFYLRVQDGIFQSEWKNKIVFFELKPLMPVKFEISPFQVDLFYSLY